MKSEPPSKRLPRTTMLGIGDAGQSAIQHILDQGLRHIRLVTINTHAQTPILQGVTHLLIGGEVAHSLGGGGNPALGRQAAEHSQIELDGIMAEAERVSIICGLGGGTGTGATPVVAQIAQRRGVDTIGIVTVPFAFEGPHRQQVAQQGIQLLKVHLDSVIVMANDLLLPFLPDRPPLPQVFALASRMLAWQALARLV
ncbi:MAG: hypothetical protein IT323_06325 [Anaerolineae bacterium]|nr:hypothetical protein [Anaerolineae bacterium]